MPPPTPHGSVLVSSLLFFGLLCVLAAFLMLGNGWLATAPAMGIQHPVAAGVGALGLLLCLASVGLRRLRRRNDER